MLSRDVNPMLTGALVAIGAGVLVYIFVRFGRQRDFGPPRVAALKVAAMALSTYVLLFMFWPEQ